jgi:hypothetical protein
MDGTEGIRSDLAVEEYCKAQAESIANPGILNSIFDDLPLIMILIDQNGKIENINRAATVALEKEKKDCVGLLGGEIFQCINSFTGEGCGKSRECLECNVRNSVMHTFETGKNIYKKESELDIVNNGLPITLNLLISTTLLQHNNEQIVLLTADDITEQKLAQKEALEASAKNEAILNLLPDLIFECKRDGTIVDYRASTENDLYAPPNEFLGKKIIEILPKELSRKTMHSIEQTIQTKELQSFQYQLPVNGKMFDFEARLVACGEDSALAIVSDISGRKIAERDLRVSEEKYSALVEKGSDGIVVIQDYVVNFANSKFGEITGYTKEEAIGSPVLDFVSEDCKELVLDRYERRIKNDWTIPYRYEIDLLSKDGKKIPVEISGSYIEYDGKSANMAIIRDITERKQMEEALQKSEQKFRTIFNNSNDPTLIYDLDGIILEVNEVACEFTGYSRDEILSMSVMDLDSPEQAAKIFDNIKHLQKEKRAIFESVSICKDGTLIPIELSNQIIEYDGKTAVLSTSRNLTERKHAEGVMFNAKIAAEDANRAKSEFIANMSHELRTPLNSVIGFSDVLYSENFGTLNETQKRYITNVSTNGKKLLELINEILDFSKVESGKMGLEIEEFVLTGLIEEIETSIVPLSSKKNIELTFNIDIRKPIIKLDRAKLKQILYNLINNAIKFTEPGGFVTIESRTSEDNISFFVKDNGIGILSEDMNKLFRPFVQIDSSRTREYGGIGIGLTIVKKFVEMHGGEVWVETEVGKGSLFGVSIPNGPEIISQD